MGSCFRLAGVLRGALFALVVLGAGLAPVSAQSAGLSSADLHRLKAITGVEVSPDGAHVAYSVQHADGPGRPSTEVRIMDVATGQSIPPGSEEIGSASCRERVCQDG